MNTTIWTDVLSSLATLAAVIVALWVAIFGPRRVTQPKLAVSVDLTPPDCMWNPGPEMQTRDTRFASGHYIIRLRVANDGNEDARDVEVMMTRLWIVDDDGKRLIDPLFLPLLLPWSWWTNPDPVRWLERLPIGIFKHCDLLTLALEQGTKSSIKPRRYHKENARPKSWMTFQAAYDASDSSGHNPLRKPPGRYELDFVVAASNATAIYRTAHISFTGWHDSATEMFGEPGGLHIEITKQKGSVKLLINS